MDASRALRIFFLLIIAFMLIMSGIHGTPGALLAAIIDPTALSVSDLSTGNSTGNASMQPTNINQLIGGIL
jgi:hypothetical protein